MATNPTGLSIAGFVKRVLALSAIVNVFTAFQWFGGAHAGQRIVSGGRVQFVSPAIAIQHGWAQLGIAALCPAGALLVWRAWEERGG